MVVIVILDIRNKRTLLHGKEGIWEEIEKYFLRSCIRHGRIPWKEEFKWKKS